MIALLKTLLRGVLTVLLSPFLLIYYVIMFIYGLINHFILEIAFIFNRKKYKGEDEETKKLRSMQEAQKNNQALAKEYILNQMK